MSMKFSLRFLLVLGGLVAAGAAIYQPASNYWQDRNQPKFRVAEITRGKILSVVNSTGTVKPVLSVPVGSFVSGPIIELLVDFNQRVAKGDLLARIDPRIYEAAAERDAAALATREAEVERVRAQLQQASNNLDRARALQKINPEFISDTELDQYRFTLESLQAELAVAYAAVRQAKANLDNSKANLEYTNIRSPVDGIVIDRKIDPGQTLAAQFQTPELFVIAPQMDEKVHIYASVDEADIGLIREAQRRAEPVSFTVDAYPDELFEGTIEQIRFSSTTTQNVVTYPVVVAAPNPNLKLLPGMTANLSFQVESRDNVLKIPNAALRFYPEREHVREEDRKLLDGANRERQEEDAVDLEPSAAAKVEAKQQQSRRHVWIEAQGQLKAVEVTTGISDHKFTELVSGDLKSGQKLVTGIERES